MKIRNLFESKAPISEYEIFGLLQKLPEYKTDGNPRSINHAACIVASFLTSKGLDVDHIESQRP